MDCSIPSKNLKLFQKTLVCVSKIGPELLLEITQDGVTIDHLNQSYVSNMLFCMVQLNIQSLNQARSAFIIFRFSKSFFSSFSRRSQSLPKVQVPVKACVSVFKAINSVETCDIILDHLDNTLCFVLHCKQDVEKKYRLSVEDSGAHKAIYNKVTPNRIIARPKTLQECVQNFHSSVEEISLVPLAGTLKFKSYVDESQLGPAGVGGKDPAAVLFTELAIDAQDFEQFVVKPNAGELTFSLKELRAILAFCEAAGQPVSIYFADPGQPILWSVNYYDCMTLDFVVATLANTASDALSSQPSTTPTQPRAADGDDPSSIPLSAQPVRRYARGASPEPRVRNSEEEEDEESNSHSYVEGTPERELKRTRHASDD